MTSRLIETLTARDENGRLYQLEIWQDFVDAGHFGDPNAEIPGLKEILTVDGDRVNYVDPNTFRLVNDGRTLKRTPEV